MKKQVLFAPHVNKSKALVRESLDGAFCHLSISAKSVLPCCPNTVFRLSYCKDAMLSGGLTIINWWKAMRSIRASCHSSDGKHESRQIMSHKKPTPIFGEHNVKICPVCGKRSYSAGGIHPQCAVQQADAPRAAQIFAKKKAEAKKTPVANKLPQTWTKRTCPKCRVEVHVRKKTCD